MRLLVSPNGFDSLRQEVRLTTREWISGMTNRPQETPLPPTVPYLAEKWPFEHYGFPSVLVLDQNNAIVVFNRPQRGAVQIDGLQVNSMSYDPERIQAVFYRRVRLESVVAKDFAGRIKRPKGRWVLVDRLVVPGLGSMCQMPNGDLLTNKSGQINRSSDGGRTWSPVDGAGPPPAGSLNVLGVLKSGRWLGLTLSNRFPPRGARHTKVGMRGGYPIMRVRGCRYGMQVHLWYSDDEGKTWQGGVINNGPFQWATAMGKGFMGGLPGTVVVPIFGAVTDDESDSYSSSNGILRSVDGGETWNDFSFIFCTCPKGPDDLQAEPCQSAKGDRSSRWRCRVHDTGFILANAGSIYQLRRRAKL